MILRYDFIAAFHASRVSPARLLFLRSIEKSERCHYYAADTMLLLRHAADVICRCCRVDDDFSARYAPSAAAYVAAMLVAC